MENYQIRVFRIWTVYSFIAFAKALWISHLLNLSRTGIQYQFTDFFQSSYKRHICMVLIANLFLLKNMFW